MSAVSLPNPTFPGQVVNQYLCIIFHQALTAILLESAEERNYFTINLYERMLPDPMIEPTISWLPVPRASDWPTEPEENCWKIYIINISWYGIFLIHTLYLPATLRLSGWYGSLKLIRGMIWKMLYDNIYLSQPLNNGALKSMQRHDVASTLMRRCINAGMIWSRE